MKRKSNFSEKNYIKENPFKAKVIKRAIRRGLKEYGETFRRLATT